MRICYVDEAGCPGALPSATSDVQPAFVILGLFVPATDQKLLTTEFIELKQTFFPGMHSGSRHTLDGILPEVKGCDIRRSVADGNRDQRRHACGFLDKIFNLLESHQAKVVSRIWVKGIGQSFNGKSVYTFSIQNIYSHFQHYLKTTGSDGIVIADSRNQGLNINVSHSIFTQKHSIYGDKWDRIAEVPLFGHSDNHAGIQISDILCSAILTPMAIRAYCLGYVSSVHTRPNYDKIQDRYSERIKDLQYRYRDPGRGDKWVGGITIDDAIGKRPGHLLFA